MPVKTQVPRPQHPTNLMNEKNTVKVPSRVKAPKKRGRKRKTRKKTIKAKVSQNMISKPISMQEISSSLRSECLRLAAFIKQSSFRKGSVF